MDLVLAVILSTNVLMSEITKHGLIIIDLQHDFASPQGSLTVFRNDKNEYLNISSSQYMNRVNKFLDNEKDRFDFIVYSIDYHPLHHCSFASTMRELGANVNAFDAIYTDDIVHQNQSWSDHICSRQTGFQVLWPDHCIESSNGSKFMEELYDIRPAHNSDDLRRVIIWRSPQLNEFYVTNYELASSKLISPNNSFKTEIDMVLSAQKNKRTANVSQVMYVFKGRDLNTDSYSAFVGNDGQTQTGLFHALNAYDYIASNTDLTVLGIAYDYCVAFTCRDAIDAGYNVTLMDQLTAPVFPKDVAALKENFIEQGVVINYTYGLATTTDYETPETTEYTTEMKDKKDTLNILLILIICAFFVVIVILSVSLWKVNNKEKGNNNLGFKSVNNKEEISVSDISKDKHDKNILLPTTE